MLKRVQWFSRVYIRAPKKQLRSVKNESARIRGARQGILLPQMRCLLYNHGARDRGSGQTGEGWVWLCHFGYQIFRHSHLGSQDERHFAYAYIKSVWTFSPQSKILQLLNKLIQRVSFNSTTEYTYSINNSLALSGLISGIVFLKKNVCKGEMGAIIFY